MPIAAVAVQQLALDDERYDTSDVLPGYPNRANERE